MSNRSPQNLAIAILLAIGTIPIFSQTSCANESSFISPPLPASAQIAQRGDSEREQQLERQREAERVLKEAERLKREVKEEGGDPNLQRRVDEQVDRARESDGSRRSIRRSDRELQQLREQKDRSRYNYDRFYYPSQPGSTTIFIAPGSTGEYQVSPGGTSTETFREDYDYDNSVTRKQQPLEVFGTVGFKNNNTSLGVGVRYDNIGLEFGAVLNQDRLNGTVNDFPLPTNNPTFSNFTDLGIKKLSPQWGADVLGFVDVAPRVSLYGSVGIYFQSLSQIVQSQASNEFYKQTNETNITGAFGGGVKFKPSDNVSIGVGYHSIRGVTGGVGVSF